MLILIKGLLIHAMEMPSFGSWVWFTSPQIMYYFELGRFTKWS